MEENYVTERKKRKKENCTFSKGPQNVGVFNRKRMNFTNLFVPTISRNLPKMFWPMIKVRLMVFWGDLKLINETPFFYFFKYVSFQVSSGDQFWRSCDDNFIEA